MLGVAREVRRETVPVDVPVDLLPMVLWFRDFNDRHTNEEVDPRDLATSLGPGIRLVRARLEMTSDPISPMPKSWPKWLSELKGEEGFIVHAYQGDTYQPNYWCSARLFKGG
jgi:hypothetical protein